jgi:hypothetical protein
MNVVKPVGINRFRADNPAYGGSVSEGETAAGDTQSFAKVNFDEIVAIAGLDPAVALLLEIKRLSGLRRFKRRDGWMPLTQELLERTNCANRFRRYRALKRLMATGVMEIRRLNTFGNKAEFRINPDWAKPKAEVVDLATARKARRRVG